MRPTTLLLLSLLAVAPVAHAADPALEAFEVGVDDNMSWSGDTINPAPRRD